MTITADAQQPTYGHCALLYRSEREYVDFLMRFIAEGVDSREPVFVAVPGDKVASLRRALGRTASDVAMADITELGRNPARILTAELAFAERHRHQRVRIVCEPVWAGRTAVEYPACVEHEALANVAFAGLDVTGLCPYDASRLDAKVLADVRVTHPLIWQRGSRTRSSEYSVDAALDQCNQPLRTNPVALTYTVREPADLAGARKCGGRYGRLLGMSADRIADLSLIATELATNSLDHGGGACQLAFWYQAGHVVCEARDIGRFTDHLAGRRPPDVTRSGPYGLFVVNAIADLLRTHTTRTGTTTHAYLRVDDATGDAS